MRHKFAPVLLMVVMAILALPFLAKPQDASTRPVQAAPVQSKTKAKSAMTVTSKLPIKDEAIEGGMWRTDGGFSPTLMLKNALENMPITVTPVLYMADGTEYDLPQVQIGMAGVAMVSIADALQQVPSTVLPHLSTYGSAAVRYSWRWPAVFGAVVNRDQVRSLVYQTHLEADPSLTHDPTAKKIPQILNSLWWKEEPSVKGFVTIFNSSLSQITATLTMTDGPATHTISEQLSLPPHASQWVDLPQLWSQLPAAVITGGMDLAYTGPQDAIQVSAGAEDGVNGYSQMLHFVPPMQPMNPSTSPTPAAHSPGISAPQPMITQPQTITIDSTGLLVGTQEADMQFPEGTVFTPYLVLRNTTTNPVPVQIAANSMTGGTPSDISLDGLTLNPLESRQIDMAPLLKSAGLGSYNGYINLRTTFTGMPTDVMQEGGSIDPTFNYVFEVPSQLEEAAGARFFNYWNTNADTDTMLTLWNWSNTPQDALLTFHHQDGKYEMPIHLEPHASLSMSIAKLIRSGAPDRNGNAIPANVVQGSGKLTGIHGNADQLNIGLAVAVFNSRTGTCTYSCITCDGAIDSWTDPTSLFLDGANSDGTICCIVEWADCTTSDETSRAAMHSDNTGIATVNSSGQVTAVALGSTYIEGEAVLPRGQGNQVCSLNNPNCGIVHVYWSCPVNVVTVTQSPSTINMSSGDTSVTISVSVTPTTLASNENVSATLSSNPNSSCTASLTFTAPGSFTGTNDNWTIDVNNNNGCGSPSGIFNALAVDNGVTSNQVTTVNVPPQVLIQMMYAEANGTGNTSAMISLGDVAFNRFDSIFSGDTTYQNTIVSGQFAINTSITTGVSPELSAAADVFTGNTGFWCGAMAFWTPTPTQWSTIQAAISSGTTAFPSGTGAPTFGSVWPTTSQQILYVSSVGTQGNGAPNFVYLDERSSGQAAAISTSCH